ncbi:hypothetical protein MPTK1_6g04680 [Marchantia polymorpha subsp. ruderalis]|uniref:Uncharacterized protein n=2 Tax=Marchantia polymorpha TaxID=3197 RepID=A0AAF6BNI4_MARPO|nr:hypothetical protein MARPO_0034s0050 [Marchantia polymorpha]BBN13568.1 hypothetical protein Mp_6g04680 [Marchantia polymorpha subsp. ruderalis]|eukprot:PTQ41463.1 hypothetical protein MARPO_0034s0050 [Marchantia polymorpha]
MLCFLSSPIIAGFARSQAFREEFINPEEDIQREKKLQQVVSIGSRIVVFCWMMQECDSNGKKDLFAKVVANFPHLFRESYKANVQKTSSWWKLKDQYSKASVHTEFLQMNQQFKATRKNFKAVAGRGRNTKDWTTHMYVELNEEFHRLQKTRLKFSTALLGTLARDIIKSNEGEFNANFRDADGKLILNKITTMWVQTFMAKHNVVKLIRGFSSSELDENLIKNMDETHFAVNVDNDRILGIWGDNDVKYADVAPMIIFTNKNRSYGIQGLLDDVPGASYRTWPKGWNDMQVFPQWLSEPRAFQHDRHNESDAMSVALTRTKTTLRFFPPCVTNKVQPAYPFVISKIKDARTKRWESKKMEMIREQQWSNEVLRDGEWSSKLLNSGKRFSLQLAVSIALHVNMQLDANGLIYAPKAMIPCGLAIDARGEWHIKQLLQRS